MAGPSTDSIDGVGCQYTGLDVYSTIYGVYYYTVEPGRGNVA